MLQSLKDHLPASETAATDWLFVLVVSYLAADLLCAGAVRYLDGSARYSIVAAVSNALLFSTSTLLLAGALHKPTLAALGSLTTYLLFAGLIGVGFAVQELFNKRTAG